MSYSRMLTLSAAFVCLLMAGQVMAGQVMASPATSPLGRPAQTSQDQSSGTIGSPMQPTGNSMGTAESEQQIKTLKDTIMEAMSQDGMPQDGMPQNFMDKMGADQKSTADDQLMSPMSGPGGMSPQDSSLSGAAPQTGFNSNQPMGQSSDPSSKGSQASGQASPQMANY